MSNETVTVLREQVEQLTRERDEALREYRIAAGSYKEACQELNGSEEDVARLQFEVKRLTAERDVAREGGSILLRECDKCQAEATRLTAERDEWRALATKAQDERDQWMSTAGYLTEEVAELRQALAAAERRTRTELARVDAAEARVRELEGDQRV